jgi:NADH dehydrogenase [ubiquinone] 1 alpha subcomplex assembly factor 1
VRLAWWPALALALCAMTTQAAPQEPPRWSIVNDGVMGGVSSSRVSALAGGAQAAGAQPGGAQAAGGVRFEGELRLENNGGFASMRRAATWPADARGVALRVRGDGNRYRLTVYTRDAASGRAWPFSYYATFATEADAVTEVAVPWHDLRATFRGRAVPDAPPVRAADVIGLGVMITKDGHRDGQGAFALDLLELRSWPAPTP